VSCPEIPLKRDDITFVAQFFLFLPFVFNVNTNLVLFMLTVALSGVRFHAPVGAYPQEGLIYNELEIHVSVSQKAEYPICLF